MPNTAPLFAFVHTLHEPAPVASPTTPVVVAIDLDNRKPMHTIGAKGVSTRQPGGLIAAAVALGMGSSGALFHAQSFLHVTETWMGVFERLLCRMEGTDRTATDPHGFGQSFLATDVFPGNMFHAEDPGFWTPEARRIRAGVFHTRDAAFWTGNADAGFAPTVSASTWIEHGQPEDGFFEQLVAAAAVVGVPLPKSLSTEQLCDRVLVGTMARQPTAHATLAARTRVAEDARLFAALWAKTGAQARPVVPVFL